MPGCMQVALTCMFLSDVWSLVKAESWGGSIEKDSCSSSSGILYREFRNIATRQTPKWKGTTSDSKENIILMAIHRELDANGKASGWFIVVGIRGMSRWNRWPHLNATWIQLWQFYIILFQIKSNIYLITWHFLHLPLLTILPSPGMLAGPSSARQSKQVGMRSRYTRCTPIALVLWPADPASRFWRPWLLLLYKFSFRRFSATPPNNVVQSPNIVSMTIGCATLGDYGISSQVVAIPRQGTTTIQHFVCSKQINGYTIFTILL